MVSIFLECTNKATHFKRAEQLFSRVFSTVWSLSFCCFLGYLGTEGNFIPSFHSLRIHFSSHSSLAKVTVDQSNHSISLRSLCSAVEPHQSWPKQFSTRNLGRHTWISIFSCCYVCFYSIKISYFSGRVFFYTHTHTPTHECRLCSFLWSRFFSFLQADFTL